MPVNFKAESGNTGVFYISGQLRLADLEQCQNECEALIRSVGNIKILAILQDFQGWEKAKGWEDLSFADRNDRYIDKFAIVGDEQWKDLTYAFTAKGLRPVPIEYFASGEEDAARQWLNND
jgi:hypothetical protein